MELHALTQAVLFYALLLQICKLVVKLTQAVFYAHDSKRRILVNTSLLYPEEPMGCIGVFLFLLDLDTNLLQQDFTHSYMALHHFTKLLRQNKEISI